MLTSSSENEFPADSGRIHQLPLHKCGVNPVENNRAHQLVVPL